MRPTLTAAADQGAGQGHLASSPAVMRPDRSRTNTPKSMSQASGPVVSKTKTFLDTWLEPPILNKSTFEDHGFDRTALFEQMQPLGEPPNLAKLKMRVKSAAERRASFRPWEETAQPSRAAGSSPALSAAPVLKANTSASNSVDREEQPRSPAQDQLTASIETDTMDLDEGAQIEVTNGQAAAGAQQSIEGQNPLPFYSGSVHAASSKTGSKSTSKYPEVITTQNTDPYPTQYNGRLNNNAISHEMALSGSVGSHQSPAPAPQAPPLETSLLADEDIPAIHALTQDNMNNRFHQHNNSTVTMNGNNAFDANTNSVFSTPTSTHVHSRHVSNATLPINLPAAWSETPGLPASNRPTKSQKIRDDSVYQCVQRCQNSGLDRLAAAVLAVYQDSKTDPDLTVALDAIWTQTATAEQNREFGLRLKQKRTEIRRQERARLRSIEAQQSASAKAKSPEISPFLGQNPIPSTPPNHPVLTFQQQSHSQPRLGYFHTTPRASTKPHVNPVTVPGATVEESTMVTTRSSLSTSPAPPAPSSTNHSRNASASARNPASLPQIMQPADQESESSRGQEHGKRAAESRAGEGPPKKKRRSATSGLSANDRELLQQNENLIPGSRLRNRNRSSLAALEESTPMPMSPVRASPIPAVSPPLNRETRAARLRRDSSTSELSSVDENLIENEEMLSGTPIPTMQTTAARKQTAADIDLAENSRITQELRRPFDDALQARDASYGAVASQSDFRESHVPRVRITFNNDNGVARATRSGAARPLSSPLASPKNVQSTNPAFAASESLAPRRPVRQSRSTGARTKES